jgi:DNA polymerase-3 subunit alpha
LVSFFNKGFGEAHNATADVEATTRCFLELIRRENYTKEQLDVPWLFPGIQNKNPKEMLL